MLYFLLDAFWLIWILKYALFWLFLWQLKEYHTGRFIDHFRTHKGKKLLLDLGQIFKIIFLFILLFDNNRLFAFLFSVLFLIYLGEFFLVLRSIFAGTMKKPVKTAKSLFLTAVFSAVAVLFFVRTFGFSEKFQIVLFLVFDLLTPAIVSAVVLVFQPFFVALRGNILKKAEKKMEDVKLVSGLKVIAITGSYGKTSTKEFLSKILSKKFRVLSTKEHQNSEIGVAKCILHDLKSTNQGYPEIFIAEVGAYNKGKVAEVCSMIKPSIGVVTGVNEQHMALFGSLKNLLSAEGGGELARALPKNGILFVNGDNKYCLDLCKETSSCLISDKNKKIYGLSNKIINSDIWADSITVHKDHVSFLAIDKSGELAHFDVKVLGKQNVQNLLGAILIAKELGMNFGEISDACKNISQEQAGMVLKSGKHGIDIIDSSYSSNPDGVFADLEYFSIFGGKKVIVMPCLIELGKKSAEIHKNIGRKIGEICDLAIITSKDKFEELKLGAMEAGMKEKNIILCDNMQDIYSMITLLCKSGDAVLLEGRVPAGLIQLLTDKK